MVYEIITISISMDLLNMKLNRNTTERPSAHKVLVLAARFPNRVQPWLTNWLEETLRRGGDLRIISNGILDGSIPEKVSKLGMLSKTDYYPLETAWDKWRCLLPYFFPWSERGLRAYAGLKILIKAMPDAGLSFKEALKGVMRSPVLVLADYGIIHSHGLGMSYEYLFVRKVKCVPLVTTFHGLPPLGVNQISPEKLRAVFSSGSLFLVNTKFAERQLTALGCLEEKVKILPQGIKLDDFPYVKKPFPTDGKVVLLTVGRFHKDKGHIYAIRAVASLIRQGYKVEYHIVGVGPEHANIEATIETLGMKGSITVLKLLDDERLREQYQQAHIFILPSVRDTEGVHEETQGVVIQEAQASGAIVIATRTGGIPECVIDGENAFLVPDRNADAIEEKIKDIVAQPEKWSTWQDNARQHVEANFAIEILGDKLWTIYDGLVAKSVAS